MGDMIFFGHLVAHRFTQHATMEPSPGSGAACGSAEPSDVPLGFTRTAEYPTLTAPRMHGTPHQGIDEVLQALLTGQPPKKWAHVYTGNTMRWASLLHSVVSRSRPVYDLEPASVPTGFPRASPSPLPCTHSDTWTQSSAVHSCLRCPWHRPHHSPASSLASTSLKTTITPSRGSSKTSPLPSPRVGGETRPRMTVWARPRPSAPTSA